MEICSFDSYGTGPLYITLQHYCDVRSPVYSMASSKLCTIALFMNDTEDVKDYCKTEVETKFYFT